MLFVGLHITKCAGTTLAQHIRKSLPPQSWYFCSGFRQTQNTGFAQLPERVDFKDLRLVFGHFIHESLFCAAGDRPVFLFAGIRSPIERAISEFYQMCKVRLGSSEPPLSTDEFFQLRNNTMCREILRAFPSLAGSARDSLAAQAIEIAAMFDLVYETENFAATIAPLLKLMRVGGQINANANVRARDSLDRRLAATEAEIRARFAEYFQEDEVLYRHLKPHAGKLYPFKAADGTVSAYRAHCEPILRANEDGMERLAEHFAKYFVAEYRNLARMDELHELLRRKQRWISALREHAT